MISSLLVFRQPTSLNQSHLETCFLTLNMVRIYLILGSLVASFICRVLGQYTIETDQYGIILDAGSSGTKLKVYKWQKPKLITEVPSLDLTLHGPKFRPGIGHFAKRPEELTEYLTNIVTEAKKNVPENMRSSTPIYLMTTAGARILDGNIALGLLNRIRNVISNKTMNPFRFNGRNVRVLSGEEEAVFAWVAINALSGFFNSSRPAVESLGLLEMGGGSTQIAFVPSQPLYAGEFQVFIGGRRYDLYAHSYLFYGTNYIKQRIRDHLVRVNEGATVIHNPCRLKGDDIVAHTNNGTKVTFLGESNPASCTNILHQFLTKAKGNKCYPKPCAIGSVYQPHVGNTSFYATQAFVYAPQNMGSLDFKKHLNITHLRHAAKRYCSKSLQEVKKTYPGNVKYASDECLMGLYIPMLLHHSYQFDPELTSVTVSNKINNKRIDWTRGAMLYEVNMMFQSRRLMPQTTISCKPTNYTQVLKPEPNSLSSVNTMSLGIVFICIITVVAGT